ncbi:M56 family metallopeptidase [Catalinimonas niigatensis]|uniref:M56 family metallopeptidase n=1 Tax=Catalinimonas niigatensis TaxID=1397264 RepID=UPI0026658933|nr:M56 family metallopeptidase [Catalinimonas niigatensis]WPP48880.1 M56 family metallopeptidase [Catalinimonas niigatensis]
MNHLLIYVLESSICLGVFYLFYVMVLHDQPSHQYNRFYLLATSCLSFILPLLKVPILLGEGVGNMAGTYQNYILLDPTVLSDAKSMDWTSLITWQNVLLLLYVSGVLLSLTLFLKQSTRLVRAVKKNRVTSRKDYRLVYTQGELPTSSCFSYLFWDNTQQLTSKEAEQIIAHEEAHIRQKHSYDVFYMAILKIFFWFHPLVYLYEKALIDVHEFAADASALRQQHPGSYAKLLTRKLFDGLQLSLVNHFYKSRTLKRIKMMHLTNQKTPRYKLLLAIPLFLALFFTFSCEPEEDISKLDELKSQYDQATTAEERMQLSDADEVYMVVENQPEPEGGIKEFYQYIAQNMKYPLQARQMGIEGKVFVQFVVDEYGEITEVQSIKGIGAGCDAEAVRVLESAPAWNPGTQKGKAVKVRMVMPITFSLEGGNKVEEKKVEGLSKLENDKNNLEEIVAVGYKP